jgi:hypothetical protein
LLASEIYGFFAMITPLLNNSDIAGIAEQLKLLNQNLSELIILLALNHFGIHSFLPQ